MLTLQLIAEQPVREQHDVRAAEQLDHAPDEPLVRLQIIEVGLRRLRVRRPETAREHSEFVGIAANQMQRIAALGIHGRNLRCDRRSRPKHDDAVHA